MFKPFFGAAVPCMKNKAFVALGSCDNVQTERSIFEYANWLKVTRKQANGVTSSLFELLVAAKNGKLLCFEKSSNRHKNNFVSRILVIIAGKSIITYQIKSDLI